MSWPSSWEVRDTRLETLGHLALAKLGGSITWLKQTAHGLRRRVDADDHAEDDERPVEDLGFAGVRARPEVEQRRVDEA
jgi:hypothetical protein